MFPLPQKESRASATCPGPDSTQELSRNNGGGLEEGCSRNPDQKGLKLYQVGDPTATFSCDSSCLSSRGKIVKWFWDSAEKGYRTYHENEYDEDKNPSGIINLGTSENKLCFDLLSWRAGLGVLELLRRDASGPVVVEVGVWAVDTDTGQLSSGKWLPEGSLGSSGWIVGRGLSGKPCPPARLIRSLREEVAKFLSFYCKSPAPLKPENVVVLNGCASLFSALATVLCEVGEAFLIPTPYYGAITQHVFLYGSVRLVYVHLDSEGVKVKGLILINPQNPLGDIYSPGELQEYLEFAKRLPDPQRTHVMWATSKDFGMSGLRFGTLYTENQDVATAVASLCRYHGLSGLLQSQMAQMLRDRDWINQVYLPENHARLKAAHAYVSEELRALGVPFLSRGAGFFIWVDLRKFLPKGTFEEEMQLWYRFLENKVLLSYGKAFQCREPGWFRIIFSDRAHRLRLGEQPPSRPSSIRVLHHSPLSQPSSIRVLHRGPLSWPSSIRVLYRGPLSRPSSIRVQYRGPLSWPSSIHVLYRGPLSWPSSLHLFVPTPPGHQG
ncbi:1-aminocyclopropane-1-carboxylate synthase-like protein 1 [Tupaia chinensis]|uniref:1-aminocyclopropane-1-carboxylate synthase-like protein 1 n=1 Tax=Tupaia chinensis TaxID=246437 RepID=L9JDX6_TUPCH|nr:1-aminocyclopropane-1-carboxylate synthase-like protein 1 [Tupaia chinensis]